jgi:signal transduction histidine kinase
VAADSGTRLGFGAEVALASACGLGFFALLAIPLAVADSRLLPVLFLAVAGIAALVAMFRFWGVAYAVPASVSGLLAFDWFYIPPVHPHAFPDAESFADLIVYVGVGVLIGELAARAGRRADTSELARSELADEQAALRRVATLVAEGAPPSEVFGAVAEEVGQLLPVDFAIMGRYEDDHTITAIAASGTAVAHFPVGSRSGLEGDNLVTIVFETRRPARVDRFEHASGPIGEVGRASGFRSTVGAPIVVDGGLWGVIAVGSTHEEPLPADTETRLTSFTELVATAVANAESRAALAASRARIVAAADDERRRVVRDLHDGAQQRLVHTIITLKMACRALEEKQEDGPALLDEALAHAEQATEELRELAHGIMPSVLTRGGLRAGVGALAARMPLPVETGVSVDRLPPAVEATAYFIVAEALTNVAKHSNADSAIVTVRVENATLHLQVRDDGIGGAQAGGSGLVGLADRVAALEGSWRLESPDGEGTMVAVEIPLS